MIESHPHRRQSYRLLLSTLWLTLLVLGVEAIAGWTSQSLLLFAEALHTLVDAFATGLGLVAVAAPQRPLGREVLGHGRIEVVTTLAVVAVLGFTGISLLWAAVEQGVGAIAQGGYSSSVVIERPLVFLTAGLIALSLGLALYLHFRSATLGSLALSLNARHILSDAWLSGVTLGGLVAIWQGQTWLDPLLAGILTVLAARSLWRALNSHVPMLLRPMAIAPEAIAHIATQVEGVTRCVRIRSRGLVGRQVWIELHIAIHPEFLGVAHLVGERVDAALRQQYGPVRTQIWVEESHPPPSTYLDSAPSPWPQTPTPETDWP